MYKTCTRELLNDSGGYCWFQGLTEPRTLDSVQAPSQGSICLKAVFNLCSVPTEKVDVSTAQGLRFAKFPITWEGQ